MYETAIAKIKELEQTMEEEREAKDARINELVQALVKINDEDAGEDKDEQQNDQIEALKASIRTGQQMMQEKENSIKVRVSK